MFDRIKGSFEKNSGKRHKDYESRNTSVSEYLRKYGTGKLETLPTDTRPEVNDDRSSDDMLNDEFVEGLGTDELDVLMKIDENKERFQKAIDEVSLTKAQRVKFDNAMKVLNDRNSSTESLRDAYRVLDELEEKGKVKRARKN